MTLEVEIENKPIQILGRLEPVEPWKLEDVIVKIDGKLAPPFIRDLIVGGLAQKAGITGLTFAQILEQR